MKYLSKSFQNTLRPTRFFITGSINVSMSVDQCHYEKVSFCLKKQNIVHFVNRYTTVQSWFLARIIANVNTYKTNGSISGRTNKKNNKTLMWKNISSLILIISQNKMQMLWRKNNNDFAVNMFGWIKVQINRVTPKLPIISNDAKNRKQLQFFCKHVEKFFSQSESQWCEVIDRNTNWFCAVFFFWGRVPKWRGTSTLR